MCKRRVQAGVFVDGGDVREVFEKARVAAYLLPEARVGGGGEEESGWM